MTVKKILLQRKNSNDPQIKSYVKAVQAGQKIYHLTSNDGKWIVKKALAEKAVKTFSNKAEATIYASKIAKSNRTELIIHGKDGRIQNRRSFGG